MTPAQIKFLRDEFWMLSYGGALQRSSVYNEVGDEVSRKEFRKDLCSFIEKEIIPKYVDNSVSDNEHIHHLQRVISKSTDFEHILNYGTINIGIAQKLLNLVLKYYWTVDWIKEPPHFPVDRIIQAKLPPSARRTWTKMTNVEEYMSVIVAARDVAGEVSLAEWELEGFERR